MVYWPTNFPWKTSIHGSFKYTIPGSLGVMEIGFLLVEWFHGTMTWPTDPTPEMNLDIFRRLQKRSWVIAVSHRFAFFSYPQNGKFMESPCFKVKQQKDWDDPEKIRVHVYVRIPPCFRISCFPDWRSRDLIAHGFWNKKQLQETLPFSN